jgi:hypothetical protein
MRPQEDLMSMRIAKEHAMRQRCIICGDIGCIRRTDQITCSVLGVPSRVQIDGVSAVNVPVDGVTSISGEQCPFAKSVK